MNERSDLILANSSPETSVHAFVLLESRNVCCGDELEEQTNSQRLRSILPFQL